MKNFKKIMAAVMALCLCLGLTACHEKGEIAVTVGDEEFTSAYYMAALIEADLAAKQEIDSKKSENSDGTSGTTDYYKEKIDGKSFETYVKDSAIEKLKENAAYIIKCKENKVEIKEDELSNLKSYVDFYWSSYGYSQIYEPNGVSKETYSKFSSDSYYSSAYFDYVYGKDGKKAVSDSDIKTYREKNYALAEILDVDFSSLEDAQKTIKTEQFKLYYEELNSGKKTFKEVYEEYNNVEDANKQDSYAQVIGGADTNYANDNYDTVKAMKNGEVKLVTKENNGGYTIIVKKDLEADKDKIESLDSEIRHQLKDDEFDKDIKAFAKTLKVKENKKATKQFKVKKIEYPETNSPAQ